jgi:hypothetical protein
LLAYLSEEQEPEQLEKVDQRDDWVDEQPRQQQAPFVLDENNKS